MWFGGEQLLVCDVGGTGAQDGGGAGRDSYMREKIRTAEICGNSDLPNDNSSIDPRRATELWF